VRFVLHFYDDHVDSYKNHQVKAALEVNAKANTERHLPVPGFRTNQGEWNKEIYGGNYSCSVLVAYMCYRYGGGKKPIAEFFQYLVQAHQDRNCQNLGCYDNPLREGETETYDPVRFCTSCVFHAFKELINRKAGEDYDFSANLLIADTIDEQAEKAMEAIERGNPLWALLFEHYDSHAVCFHGYGRCPDQKYWFCRHDPYREDATDEEQQKLIRLPGGNCKIYTRAYLMTPHTNHQGVNDKDWRYSIEVDGGNKKEPETKTCRRCRR